MYISNPNLMCDQMFKIWKSKFADSSHVKNQKRNISYVRFWQNFAWWCRFGLQTLGLT